MFIDDSAQTLHSFVLSMLTDQSALTAFVSNPEAALSAAGLDGISAADVHDAIPMVIDYAPAGAVASLESAFSSLSVDSLEAGQAGAIQQLQAVAQSLTSTVTSATAGGLGGHFDLAGAGSELTGGLVGGLEGVAGSVAAAGPDSALSASFAGGLQGVAGSVAASVAGHELGGALAAGVDGLTVSYESPLGDNTFHVGAGSLPIPSFGAAGDVADTLDSTLTSSLANGASLVTTGVETTAALATGTLADPQGAVEALANGSTVNALTGQVTGVLASAGGPVSLPALPATAPATAAQLSAATASTVHEATHIATAGVSQVTGVLSQVPGAAPVAAQLHDVTHEATHLLNGVVSDLPAQLPVGDPFTATGAAHAGGAEASFAASQSPVTDVAGASAVTGVVDQVHSDVSGLTHGLLPDVHLPL